MFLQMMDQAHWLWASLMVLLALALSAVCIYFRKGSGTSLCSDCRYNDARLCERVERPYAKTCTSYRPGQIVDLEEVAKASATDSEKESH